MSPPRTHVLTADTVASLADELVQRARAREMANRLIVGIAGIPGSGKSTLARAIVQRMCSTEPRIAALVPMDGFHLSNQRLCELGLGGKKGSPETFDAEGFVALLERARPPGAELYFPIYDRSLHEPVVREDDAQRIFAETRIILTEGNYLLLDIEPWRGLAGVLDEAWWLDTPLETARRWIIDRHMRGGKTLQQATAHHDAVDRANSELVMSHQRRPDRVLQRP